ncbi:diguanylate cyclase domain-containing protein [Undibacterium sp.]|uniref:sensor domain-containing diguanylate cyclase n=1 Tax=Undibacterium sp. TaxID=1914977 RepID=UPI002730EE25|nr:diguanylate cyclase [Undibacterium sp.]MDP1977175.1 diguanylate cyclase [Undibacterium sp.]
MSSSRFSRFRDISLKTRLTMAVAVFFVISLALLSWLATSVSEQALEKLIVARQNSVILAMANEVDQKVELRKNALILLATDLATDDAGKEQLQEFMSHQKSLSGLFDNLAVVNLQGELVAVLHDADDRGKINLAGRDYFQEVLNHKKLFISPPQKGTKSSRPLIVMCVPVFDGNSQLRYVLAGIIELEQDSFLADLAITRIGGNGYFYVTTQQGIFVAHPESSRILADSHERPDKHPLPKAAYVALEGSLISRNGENDEAILSYRRLKSVDWIIAAAYPSSEAFVIIADVRKKITLASSGLLMILLLLGWWFMYWQLKPLQHLRNKVNNAVPDWMDTLQEKIYPKDEIGDLAKAFDDAMAKRRAAEAALSASENKLRLIADNMSAFIGYIDHEEKYTFANKRIAHLSHMEPADVIGKSMREVATPDIYDRIVRPHVVKVLNGEWTRYERRIQRYGHWEWDRVTYAPDFNKSGQVDGFFVLVEDITEFKRVQDDLMRSEERVRTITDNVPAMIAYIDANERYQFCNRNYGQIPGLEPGNLLGKTIAEVFGEQTYIELKSKIQQALHGEKVSFERYAPERNIKRFLQYEYVPDINEKGETLGYYSMVIDITARKEAELKLAASESLLRTIADNIPAFVSLIDTENRYQFINRPYETWFDLPLPQIRCQPVSSLLSGTMLQEHQTHYKLAMAGEKTEFETEISIAGQTGYYHATYVPQYDESGKVVGVNTLINDISDAKAVEKQLLALARFDTLTGLPNRNQINERMEQASARSQRNGRLMAVMFLDVDKFKRINDSLGHHAGDLVLQEFANRLRHCIRQTDLAGRLAGDEFVIVLEGLNMHSEADMVADKIVQAMTTPFNIETNSLMVTASIGVAISSEKNAGANELLKKADEALYMAKNAGRNNFKVLQLD